MIGYILNPLRFILLGLMRFGRENVQIRKTDCRIAQSSLKNVLLSLNFKRSDHDHSPDFP